MSSTRNILMAAVDMGRRRAGSSLSPHPPAGGRGATLLAPATVHPSRSCSISRQGSDLCASLDGSELSGAPAAAPAPQAAWGTGSRHSPHPAPAAPAPQGPTAAAAVAVIAAGAAAAAAASSGPAASAAGAASPAPPASAAITWAARLAGGSRSTSPAPLPAPPHPHPGPRGPTPRLPIPAARLAAGGSAAMQPKAHGPSWAAAVAGTFPAPPPLAESGTVTPAQRPEERTPFARIGSPPSQPSSLSAETQSSGVNSPPGGFRNAPTTTPPSGGGGRQCSQCRAAQAEAAAAVMGSAAVQHRAALLEEQARPSPPPLCRQWPHALAHGYGHSLIPAFAQPHQTQSLHPRIFKNMGVHSVLSVCCSD